MITEQGIWNLDNSIIIENNGERVDDADLVIFFTSHNAALANLGYQALAEHYPRAQVVGCTTGGEILGEKLLEESFVFSAMKFATSKIKTASITLSSAKDSFESGATLAKNLKSDNLKGLLILSDGLNISGTELVKGVNSIIDPRTAVVFGGLAGDSGRYENTFVSCNGPMCTNCVVMVGFYGKNLEIKTGNGGGWEAFGQEYKITKVTQGNVLQELDGKPALALYKSCLGEEADSLPGSAVGYPMAMWNKGDGRSSMVLRTVLDISDLDNSLIFAGDVPEGATTQLMWGKFDGLVEGAEQAASDAAFLEGQGDFSIVISCIGRKILLGPRVAFEVDKVAKRLNSSHNQIGFYSYGEIAPHANTNVSVLQNQSIMVFNLREIAS